MNRYVKVVDHPGLVRDVNTGAIINVDQTKARQANEIRNAQRARTKQLGDLSGRVETLENVVGKINRKLDRLIELLSKDS